MGTRASDRAARRAAPGVARLAALVALGAFAAACAEPAPRGRTAPTLAVTDPNRGLAYLSHDRVVVRVPARGAERELAVAGATAFAWATGGRAVYVAAGLEVWRAALDGAAPERVAAIRDPANDTVARLETRVDGRGFVAMTARSGVADPRANARFWEVDLAGAVRETTARDADALAGRRPRAGPDLAVPIVSPSGRWELRVAGLGAGGATERLLVAPAGGAPRSLVDLAALPVDADARYTGVFDDAGWAAGRDTVLFVAETHCGETCSGPLFAIEPDGAGLRRLAASVEEVPREWNGTEAALADFPSGTEVVMLADVATGERVELGPGAMPKWQPAVHREP